MLLQRVAPGLESSSSPQEREQPVARNARAGTRKHAKGALREDVAADATRRDAVVRREGDMSFARPDVSMYISRNTASLRCRPRVRRVRVARVGRCRARRVEEVFTATKHFSWTAARFGAAKTRSNEIGQAVSAEIRVFNGWFLPTTLTSARQTKCPYEQKTRVDICHRNLAQRRARVLTGSNEQPFDVSALVAPRATRGSLRDSHRGRSRGAAAECARVSARGAGAEESSPVRRVSRRVARTSVAHLVSEATTGGRCQSLDAARLDAGSGYRVGSRAHQRAHRLSSALGGVDRTPLRAETRARASASRSPFAEKRTPARHLSDSDRTRGAGEMAGRAPDAGAAEASVKGSSAAMAEVRARGRADEDPDISATRTPASGATRRRRAAKTSLRYFG